MMLMKKVVLFIIVLFVCCFSFCAKAQVYAQQITPEVFLEVTENGYAVHFSLPPYELGIDDGNDYDVEYGYSDTPIPCGEFTVINMDADYDVTDVPGYPELPFFPINLVIPFSDYEITFEPDFIESVGVAEYVDPAIGDGIIVDDFSCYNHEYYENGVDEEYPNGFYRNFYEVSEPYWISEAMGLTLSIHPFSYYPHQDRIDVLYNGTFYIEFGDTEDLPYVINSFEYNAQNLDIWLYFDNYNDMTYLPDLESRGNYLIVAANRNMLTALDPYVEYKLNQGYNVDVVYLNQHNALGNVDAIVDLINGNNYLGYPDYVLLVGSLDDIPPFEGSIDVDYPYTDDGYHPKVGRWIISDFSSNYPTLTNIINKTISTETQLVNMVHWAALFSGSDSQSRRMENKFYKQLKKICNRFFDSMNMSAILHDGRDPNMSVSMMVNEIEDSPNFFIYNGHGIDLYQTTAIGSPYNLAPSATFEYNYAKLQSLNNNSPYPLGFGFACRLNTYNTNMCFGSQWVEEENGGVAFYGATVITYLSPDGCFSKKIFNKLKQLTNKKENFPLSNWLYCSEQAYYNAFMSANRWKQIRKYNLIGDPTLYVYGLALNEEDIYYSPKAENLVEVDEIKAINVFDISGRLILRNTQGNISDILTNLNKGVYLVRVVYESGKIETIKYCN